MFKSRNFDWKDILLAGLFGGLAIDSSIYVMMHFPFFGVNSDFWLMQNKEIPHFLSLYFSAEYGIFAGVLCNS